MNKIIFFLFLFLYFIPFAQERNDIVQQRIEFISEQLESESIDLTNLLERFNYYYDNPIDLNSASLVDLGDLGLLSDIQINDLIVHRKLHGKLISIYEIQSLRFWDIETINLVLPFVTLDERLDGLHLNFKEALKEGKFDLFLRFQPTIESKSGYTEVPDSVVAQSSKYYYGNSHKYYSRFRYSYKTNISFGITAEKDAGEAFFRGAQKNGFDFYSFHAFYKGGKYLKSIALGDYQIQLGQGIQLWSGYAFGKSSDILTMKRNPVSIKPYTSVDESRFFRGVALNFAYKNFDLLFFSSLKRIDASGIQDSLEEDLEIVSSINLSGLHRTHTEIEKRDALREFISGVSVQFQNDFIKIGVQGVYQEYDQALQLNMRPYNQFYFSGSQLWSISTDYNYVYRNLNVFGEIAYSSNERYSGIAMLHGALLAIDTRLSLGLLYRDYDEKYQTMYNAGFSEGSRTQNENGLYAGFKLNLSGSWSIKAYTDVFEFPWLKYGIDAASRGHEFLIQPIYRPNKSFEVYGRYREQLRQKNESPSEGDITKIEDVTQRNFRINVSNKVNKELTLKSRIEWVSIKRKSRNTERGLLITQDIAYKPKSFPLSFTLRYALFDTDSYDSRIYSYENNALYVFSVPAHYYKGSRCYFLARYSFSRRIDVWVKYGFFLYNNRNEIGSGAEQIQGDRKSDLTVQLKISL
jgi:hypothetical protein|tara:strand:- start:21021 stop:23093 length:2073 start_codon:yes stop_codon:yes gene_type:complete